MRWTRFVTMTAALALELAAFASTFAQTGPTKTPTRKRGFFSVEGSPPSAPAEAPDQTAAAPSAASQAAPAAPAAPAGFDAEIASLRTRLARAEEATSETIEPLKDLAAARETAAVYRTRVDRMRRLLYVSDPKPDGRTATELRAIQSRWGDHARPIVDGELPEEPLPQKRWADYAGSFDPACQKQTASLTKMDKVPLRGWAWACLSDSFFKEFAGIEARVERDVTAQRRQATRELDGRMRIAEERLALAGQDGSGITSLRLFLLNETLLLRDVWVEAAKIRIKELKLQRAAGSGTPVFRWFLDMTPAVRRPVTGSRPIPADAGTSLKVKSGKSAAEAQVKAPRKTAFSDKLHQVHYRLANVERRVDNQTAEELAEYRRTVSDPTELQARAADLEGRRSGRIESARKSLEQTRADTVAALANEAK